MPKPKPRKPTKQTTLVFDFVKSPQYRVIHVDGAYGGLTSQGFISMDLYSEFPSIPDSLTLAIDPVELTAKEVKRAGKQRIIREREATVLLTRKGAAALRDWLGKKIEEMDAIRQEEITIKEA